MMVTVMAVEVVVVVVVMVVVVRMMCCVNVFVDMECTTAHTKENVFKQ